MLTLGGDQNGETKKKKQKLVKHKRKNWSKTDISDVERGIEDVRHQELTGGVRAEKKDEELFYISKTKLPDEVVDAPPAKRQKLSFEEKMKSLKCYKMLEPDPVSAPVHIHEVRKEPDVDSRHQTKKREVLARKAKKFIKHKKLPDPTETVDKKERKCNKQLETDFKKDIWTTPVFPEVNEVNEFYLKGTKQVPPSRPERLNKKPSALPSIPAPHPGMSYNPDYDEHQDLLLKAHTVELKKLEAEQKLMKKLTDNVKKLSWKEIEDLWLEEMAVKDLFDKDDESEREEDAQEAADKKAEISVSKRQLKRMQKGEKTKKETKAQRQKRRLLEKIRKREKENEKKIRIQQNEIYRLKSILKEVNSEVKAKEEELLKREIEAKHRELFDTKRLNSLRYEEPELEVKLSDEITGNLRTLKPEGNIMLDRYKNLQKRNIIEPRERLTRAKRSRKYSKKKFDKQNAHEKTYYIK